MSRVRQLRIESLKQDLEKLEQDYIAVDSKQRYESNPQEQNNLRRQLHAIAKQMEDIEQQLNELEQPENKNDFQTLLELLTPFEGEISTSINKAYQACSPDDWLNPVPDRLEEILAQIKTMQQGVSRYTKLEHFTACLVADSEMPPSASQNLNVWGEQNIKGFANLLNEVRQARHFNDIGGEPYLMVVIRCDHQNSVSKSHQGNYYFVDAWIIPNYNATDGFVCEPLSKPHSFRETLTLDEIPELLRAFLQQSNRYSLLKLTIEIFLPLDLIDQAVANWEIDDEFDLPVMLGSQYKIVVRSYERILPNYLYKGSWEEKWRILQQLAKDSVYNAFATGDENDFRELFVKLSKQNVIGLKLATAPVQTGKGSVFALILKTAIPVALWLRQNIALNCEEQIDGLLNCCIYQLPENVKTKRLEALPKPPDTHIGHHLCLLWEDPYRLPPNIEYSM